MSRPQRDMAADTAPGRRHREPDVATEAAGAAEAEDEAPAAPWHFKVLLLGTAGYLVYRLVWFIFWLTGHGWHG